MICEILWSNVCPFLGWDLNSRLRIVSPDPCQFTTEKKELKPKISSQVYSKELPWHGIPVRQQVFHNSSTHPYKSAIYPIYFIESRMLFHSWFWDVKIVTKKLNKSLKKLGEFSTKSNNTSSQFSKMLWYGLKFGHTL